MVEWDESLETGIPIVDEQHRALFRQIGDLLDRSRPERVKSTLEFLDDYVLMHFGTEEIMQSALKYPDADEHKKMHDAFVSVLVELKKEYESSDNAMLVLLKLTKVALDWLKYHIGGADKEFGKYFKSSSANL